MTAKGRHTSYQHPKCRLGEKDDIVALSINMGGGVKNKGDDLKNEHVN